MPLQHYLPATFLAGFSSRISSPRRKSTLAAADLRDGRTFTANAEGLAGVNDLYTLTSFQLDPQLVDKTLSGYEAGLASAISQLKSRELTAMTWATVLVPFVAGLLVRGPDFGMRFGRRMRQLGIDTSADNTNFGRWMEFKRMLAPVSVAQWIVLTVRSDEPLITNDIGHAPFFNSRVGHRGMAVPLDLTTTLMLVPTSRREVAVGFGGDWYPIIDYLPSPGDNHVDLNQTLALRAGRFVFGPDTYTVKKYLREQETVPPPLDPGQMGFVNGYQAMLHDMDWHRLITYLSRNPPSDGQFLYLDLLSSDFPTS